MAIKYKTREKDLSIGHDPMGFDVFEETNTHKMSVITDHVRLRE